MRCEVQSAKAVVTTQAITYSFCRFLIEPNYEVFFHIFPKFCVIPKKLNVSFQTFPMVSHLTWPGPKRVVHRRASFPNHRKTRPLDLAG